MIVGLQQSVPIVVKTCSETAIDGNWLSKGMDDCITKLSKYGFKVSALVADNHSSNVKAFSNLLSSFNGDQIFIHHPAYGNQLNTYLFYDMVHIIKNIRNNLVNSKKFIFPAFNFDQLRDKIFVPSGYVQWSLFHRLHEEETKLDPRLRKAHKINPTVLHPGQNKQDVSRALAIFHETTSAVIKSYFPHRQDAAQFLNLIHKVFLVWNSKTRAHGSNSLGDAAKTGDNKVCFLRAVADWIEEWNLCPNFTLRLQTGKAIVVTLRARASLIEDLLQEGYNNYFLTAQYQSDPLERRFSRYRQMNGGNFLVSFREVCNSEKILLIQSPVREGLDFWKDGVSVFNPQDYQMNDSLQKEIEEFSNDLHASELSASILES